MAAETAPAPTLTGLRACVFDAYGTLFDVHAPVTRLRLEIGAPADLLSARWRAKQLEYTWLRSLMGLHADFWQVTCEALDFALEETGLTHHHGLRGRLLDLYRTLDAYPDAALALDTLRAAGIRTAILSNGSPDMLAAAVTSAGLGERLDAVLSVEEVGIYKPHPMVYQLALTHLAAPREAIGFVSSNGWDVAGAAAFGLRVVWLNRAARVQERLPAGPEAVIADLDALPAALGVGQ